MDAEAEERAAAKARMLEEDYEELEQTISRVNYSSQPGLDNHYGQVYSWGQGVLGQLGHGETSNSLIPRQIAGLKAKRAKQISTGSQHVCVLTDDGEVWTWGRGNFGQLGHREFEPKILEPRVVEYVLEKTVTMVACGAYHTGVLTDTNDVYAFGCNEYGRLGTGNQQNLATPTLVEGLVNKGIKGISFGGFHSAAWSRAGSLYTWGGNFFGQLGLGDEHDRMTPRRVSGLRGKRVRQVSCGTHHTCCITDDLLSYSWGSGELGKLGHGSEEDENEPRLIALLEGKQPKLISAGNFHTGVLTKHGEIFTWGSGANGRLGHDDEENLWIPIEVQALKGKEVTDLNCGEFHTACIIDAAVWTWGSGQYGKLGQIDESDSLIPVEVTSLKGIFIGHVVCGGFHTIAISVQEVEVLEQETLELENTIFGGLNTTKGSMLKAGLEASGEGDSTSPFNQIRIEAELQQRVKDLAKDATQLKKRVDFLEVENEHFREQNNALERKVSQMRGSKLDGMNSTQLEELEKILYDAVRLVGQQKAARLRMEYADREQAQRNDLTKQMQNQLRLLKDRYKTELSAKEKEVQQLTVFEEMPERLKDSLAAHK